MGRGGYSMIGGPRRGARKRRAGPGIVIALVAVAPVLPVAGAAGWQGPAQAMAGPATPVQFTHRQDVTGPGDGDLTSVSCPTVSFCAAIDGQRAAVIFNGSAWSKPQLADPQSFLESVSCPAANFCLAVDLNGHAVTYHGTTWSAPVTADAGAAFGAVSCASATFCVASSGAQVLTFNGIGWCGPPQPRWTRPGTRPLCPAPGRRTAPS